MASPPAQPPPLSDAFAGVLGAYDALLDQLRSLRARLISEGTPRHHLHALKFTEEVASSGQDSVKALQLLVGGEEGDGHD